jgi:hypothetical protein
LQGPSQDSVVTIKAQATETAKNKEKTKTPNNVEKIQGAANTARTIETKTHNQAKNENRLNMQRLLFCF